MYMHHLLVLTPACFWHAGKQIVVQYIPEAAYNIKFPAAQNAFVPLQ